MMAIIIKSVLDSKNIIDDTLSQLPFTIPFIWLTIGLFGMLPDVAWLPTAMIVLITIFAWVSGRLESFPLLVISMFAALAIGFHNDFSDSGAVTDGELWDVISLSAFYGAVYSLIVSDGTNRIVISFHQRVANIRRRQFRNNRQLLGLIQ